MNGKAEQQLFLGIDTSAYTTSLALVDGGEKLLWEQRRPLPVGKGGLGLRQSEAVFKHLLNVPPIWSEASGYVRDRGRIAVVAASVRPRPPHGSYMPVFKVGEAFASVIAQSTSASILPVSHQEGHVQAGLWSAGLPRGRYLVMHISGGTTDLLDVTEETPGSFRIEPAGGSADLNAGQFIDRVGVAMGLEFPAGPALEELANCFGDEAPLLPVAVRGTAVSFSGPASQAERLLAKGCDKAALARAVEICVADSLADAILAVPGLSSRPGVLLVGGVAANRFICRRIAGKLQGLPLSSAKPAYAGDNAAGLAVQAARQYLYGNFR